MRVYILLIVVFFIFGCENKPITTVYDKSILTKKIECLQLSVIPYDNQIATILQHLYPFEKTCGSRVEVSFKHSIVCNSHYNSQSKALGKMPNSYLKIEFKHGLRVQYSYYIDLDHKPNKEDIKEGFARVRKDLHI